MSGTAFRDFAPQGSVYDSLALSLNDGRFSHATLITGPRGVGKRSLAACIAQYLLCSGESKPCGQCPGCRQVLSGSHPDLLRVTVPSDRKTIPVDSIREINEAVGLSTYEGGRRVIVITPAEALTPASQNALLKNLEEPLPGNFYLLTAESTAVLLPTVISRCRQVALHPWPDAYVEEQLRKAGASPDRIRQTLPLCGGSIGKALELAEDEDYWKRRGEIMTDFFGTRSRGELLNISEKWQKRAKGAESAEDAPEEEAPKNAKNRKKKPQGDSAGELLNDLEDMLHTLLLVRLKRAPADAVSAFPAPWQRMAQEGEIKAFLALEDTVRETRRLRAVNVTWQALIEKLLLRMMEETDKWSVS